MCTPGNVGSTVREGQIVEGCRAVGQAIKRGEGERGGFGIKKVEVVRWVGVVDATTVRQRVHGKKVVIKCRVWTSPAEGSWPASMRRH